MPLCADLAAKVQAVVTGCVGIGAVNLAPVFCGQTLAALLVLVFLDDGCLGQVHLNHKVHFVVGQDFHIKAQTLGGPFLVLQQVRLVGAELGQDGDGEQVHIACEVQHDEAHSEPVHAPGPGEALFLRAQLARRT